MTMQGALRCAWAKAGTASLLVREQQSWWLVGFLLMHLAWVPCYPSKVYKRHALGINGTQGFSMPSDQRQLRLVPLDHERVGACGGAGDQSAQNETQQCYGVSLRGL